MLEESAFKEKREIETRQNAEDLHRYLDFADIDWKNVKPSDFEVICFSGKTKHKEALLPPLEERLSRRYRSLNNFNSRGGPAHSQLHPPQMRYELQVSSSMIHDTARLF